MSKEKKFKEGELVTTYKTGVYKIVKILSGLVYNKKEEIPYHLQSSKKVGDKKDTEIHARRVLSEEGYPSESNTIHIFSPYVCFPVKEMIERKEKELKELKENINCLIFLN